ncbi:hypothetical protein MJO55_29430 (plasmid) [Mycolicibacterium rufum]|uniref:Uncharacterized protein n=2 Tax=Mycolicibacterium rufum TaxID=318424 RepID=A0ABY5TSS9_9MYCO|nr:hypothetical protein [Mycolicibacterium rufum]KGI65875.1 hypothetical protein EU78_28815 [Mycolicibacterium rufum]UVY95925.1 hypothetical protein MJO55_29430 [Mycolicibacterium rufum]
MDLFVRAARSDNLVIDELLAPATAGVPFGGRGVPMRGLVVDAPTAHAQPALRQAAEGAGLPLIVDPLTHLFQDEQPADKGWATLSFAAARALPAEHFLDRPELTEMVRKSIAFQLDHGATILVPPYFHAKSPGDPWFQVQLAANRCAAAFLRGEGINLQVAPILAGSLKTFGARKHWAPGVDEFLRSIATLNVRYVPVALSSSRPTNGDTEDRIGNYLAGGVQIPV